MAEYVLAFRAGPGEATPDTEQAWGEWFGRIGEQVAEFGRRVGQTQLVGDPQSAPGPLGGYIVLNAESLEAAAAVAEGCPGLAQGGHVEVGTVVPAQQ